MIATFGGHILVPPVSFTLTLGPSPNTCVIKAAGSVGVPDQGYLHLSVEDSSITIGPLAAIDRNVEHSADGEYTNITLADRRILWQFGRISGIYNRKYGSVGGSNETEDRDKTLQQLMALCLARYNLSSLVEYHSVPNEYPYVEWENENPASMLQSLADAYGLAVSVSHDGRVIVAPRNHYRYWPYGSSVVTSDGETNSIFTPRSIIVVGNRLVHEVWFPNEEFVCVGLELDGTLKEIDNLSYKPGDGWGKSIIRMFEDVTNPDQRKLAEKCVFKWYMWQPKVSSERAQILPWLSCLATSKVVLGKQEFLKPYIEINRSIYDGISWRAPGEYERLDEDFSLDQDNGIIIFDTPQVVITDGPAGEEASRCALNLRAAYEAKTNDEDTDFYSYEHGMGGLAPPRVHRDSSLTLYAVDTSTLNKNELDTKAQEIAYNVGEEYGTQMSASRRYAGLIGFEPWGLIRSVTWRVGEDGAYTELNAGTERTRLGHPRYEERLQMKKISAILDWERPQLFKKRPLFRKRRW